jgi:transcriptional repressor NrdR
VLDSRPGVDQVRRRRECQDCTRRFTTYEKLAESEIIVAKRGGGQEPFDRDKLLRVVERVARGRRLAESTLRDLVRGLEAELLDVGARTVPSAMVAERLRERLRALDGIAAERFESNYRMEDGSVRMTDDVPSPQLDLLAAMAPSAPAMPPLPEGSGSGGGGGKKERAPAVDSAESAPRRRGRPPKAARG